MNRGNERGYEDEFIAAKTERLRTEEAGYPAHVMLRAATLVAIGEPSAHLAELLDVDQAVVIAWHFRFIEETQDLALTENELSFIRDKNVIRADARTKGAIVKGIVEGLITVAEASEIVGAEEQTIDTWMKMYRQDYNIMITLPPGTGYTIRSTYVLGLDAKEELQTLIFQHDREENTLAGTRRSEYINQRAG